MLKIEIISSVGHSRKTEISETVS